MLIGVASKVAGGVSIVSPVDFAQMEAMYQTTKTFIEADDISLIEDSVERSFVNTDSAQGAEACASGSGLDHKDAFSKVQKLTGTAYRCFENFLVGEHGVDKAKLKLGKFYQFFCAVTFVFVFFQLLYLVTFRFFPKA